MTEPKWVTEMKPEQRAVMAPPGLLHGHGRRNGSHQTRPKLDILYPLETGAATGSVNEVVDAQTVPLMGPEQTYLFDTTGYLHVKQAVTAEEVLRLHAELDWAEQTGAGLGKMLQVRNVPMSHGASISPRE